MSNHVKKVACFCRTYASLSYVHHCRPAAAKVCRSRPGHSRRSRSLDVRQRNVAGAGTGRAIGRQETHKMEILPRQRGKHLAAKRHEYAGLRQRTLLSQTRLLRTQGHRHQCGPCFCSSLPLRIGEVMRKDQYCAGSRGTCRLRTRFWTLQKQEWISVLTCGRCHRHHHRLPPPPVATATATAAAIIIMIAGQAGLMTSTCGRYFCLCSGVGP